MKKRVLSIFILFMMVFFNLIPSYAVASNQEYVFADSFESDFTALPEGWSYFGVTAEGNVRIEKNIASDGKNSVRVVDESAEASIGLQSPKFPVEAGKNYKLEADVYNYSGKCSVFLKFWDASGKQVFSKSVGNSGTGEWKTVSILDAAPKNAVKGSVILCITIADVGDVCYDNIRVKAAGDTPAQEDIPVQSAPVDAELISPDGADLKYYAYNEQGDKLSDFSYAGFYAGEVELPLTENLTVGATIFPSADPRADDTKRIQEIINTVAASTSPGRMTVIKFEAGRYNINKSGITLKSGIVLSGSGQGPNGTVFYATDTSQYTVIKATGGAPSKIGKDAFITDEYVRAGSTEINISAEDIDNFDVGDVITIYHPSSTEWCEVVEMDNIVNVYGDNNSWTEGKVDMPTERTIKAINGTTITLDFPMFVPLDRRYAESYIYKINETNKISNFGVENLRIESAYDGTPTDENHANVAISTVNAKNGFIRDVSAKYFILSAVRCGANSKQITVKNCSSLEPISNVQGSRRYSFSCTTSAQQILFTGCYSYAGRHDYMSSYSSTGPLAYVDSVAEASTTASETHGTWTTGLLYDNIYQIQPKTRGLIAFANRGIYGTTLSQGWSGAGCVAWNCLTSGLIAHKPSHTYQNFMIGVWGRYLGPNAIEAKNANVNAFKGIYRTTAINTGSEAQFKTSGDTPFVGDAYREAERTPVEPRSLYKAQLASRITGDYRNVKPNSPIIINPKPEENVDSIEVYGIYQRGAERVTVYVDDMATEAVLDAGNNTFKASVSVPAGWHKIYATQTIDGVEGTKNADRFIKTGTANDSSNPGYLQSKYDREKTAMITSDSRPTFDAYQNDEEGNDDDTVKIFLNGVKLASDIAFVERNGNVLVPLRTVFEALGATVEWDGATATATCTKGDLIVEIIENSDVAYINGNQVNLDAPGTVIDGDFFIPLQLVSESLGVNVDWIEGLKTVLISTADAPVTYPPKHAIAGALTVYGVKQSGDDGAGNSIEQSLDGELSTRWAVSGTDEGSAWGIYDLGEEKSLSQVYLAFHNGQTRVYTFSIAVSADGQNYTTVIDRQKTSGTTKELEAYSLKGAVARYVKFIGGGNSQNDWNSMTEIVFAERK